MSTTRNAVAKSEIPQTAMSTTLLFVYMLQRAFIIRIHTMLYYYYGDVLERKTRNGEY